MNITVIGGGIIGSSISLSLSQLGYKVYLIDIKFQDKFEKIDLRTSAINYLSFSFLKSIHVWNKIKDCFKNPYSKLEVIDKISGTQIQFDSKCINLKEFGFIIENWRLKDCIQKLCCKSKMIHIYEDKLEAISYQKKFWILYLKNGKIIKSPLVIGSDGINSKILKFSGIFHTKWKYNQSCLSININMFHRIKKVWQIFYPSGSRAFLPLYKNLASLIWFDCPKVIDFLKNSDPIFLKNKIKLAFPMLKDFKIYNVDGYNLFGNYVCKYTKPGVIFLGDSAHSFHPMLGQGLNLGFRDLYIFTKILKKYSFYKYDIKKILKLYQSKRLLDINLMQIGVNMFYFIFKNEHYFINNLKKIGFYVIKNNKFIKNLILKYVSGIYTFNKKI